MTCLDIPHPTICSGVTTFAPPEAELDSTDLEHGASVELVMDADKIFRLFSAIYVGEAKSSALAFYR